MLPGTEMDHLLFLSKDQWCSISSRVMHVAASIKLCVMETIGRFHAVVKFLPVGPAAHLTNELCKAKYVLSSLIN